MIVFFWGGGALFALYFDFKKKICRKCHHPRKRHINAVLDLLKLESDQVNGKVFV